MAGTIKICCVFLKNLRPFLCFKISLAEFCLGKKVQEGKRRTKQRTKKRRKEEKKEKAGRKRERM